MTASYAASTPAAHSVTSRLPVTITASMTVLYMVKNASRFQTNPSPITAIAFSFTACCTIAIITLIKIFSNVVTR